ncbi:hypothetical protein BDN71DRAFT_1512271 [Pleurotus eryngii]|uniref:Uncharacterized protein n=1 Tax=Pleurotus eryngii TaxID=5323 RepID=A0A9P5ZK62_PLEER|nr:hypothetical protein BDN71DRAFT_1512271 [Pleurotus eryngii]
MKSVFALAIFAAVATSSVHGAPQLKTRAAPDDVTVLNYALALEHLENAFYAGAPGAAVLHRFILQTIWRSWWHFVR